MFVVYLTMIFFTSVNGWFYNDIISFSTDEGKLSECIENQVNIFSAALRYGFVDEDIASIIRDFVTENFLGKSLQREQLRYAVNVAKTKIFRNISHKVSVEPNFSMQLSIIITNALNMCYEDENSDESILELLPSFKNESVEFETILNYILVDWKLEITDMIQTREGRALLRSYADDVLMMFLRSALDSVSSYEDFRIQIRDYWSARALRYFDGRNNTRYPYIVHRYTLEYPTPYTDVDVESNFFNRINQSFTDRDPEAPTDYLKRILYIHAADRPGRGESDPYFWHEVAGMTSAEYYFEAHIDQFYRILFFYLELQARGIRTDNDDIYPGILPYEVVPEEIQAIVYNDTTYREYLLKKRLYESSVVENFQNSIRQNLSRNARVGEEYLITLMMDTPSTSGVTTRPKVGISASTTTTTNRIISTTSRNQNPWKRKGSNCDTFGGDNHDFKRSKTPSTSNGCDNGHKKSGSDNTKEAVGSIFQEQYNDCLSNSTTGKEIACRSTHPNREQLKIETNRKYTDDLNSELFPAEESLFLMKSSRIILSELIGDSSHGSIMPV